MVGAGRPHGSVLVFCPTRAWVESAASMLGSRLPVKKTEGTLELHRLLYRLGVGQTLCDAAIHGVGFHHAGLDMQARAAVESAFREGVVPVVVTTNTLAVRNDPCGYRSELTCQPIV